MKVAAQGINLIQIVGHDIGLSASSPVAKKGVDDFSQRFSGNLFYSSFAKCDVVQ